MNRTQTRKVRIGRVAIGGGEPVAVQSMATTDTRDPDATVAQIERLEALGCEIVRVAVPDQTAAAALREIKSRIRLPLVADIHFDYRLALTALESGVDKLRLNPGNIGEANRVRIVAREAKARGVPIRVGANVGSISKEMLRKYGEPCADALVESALDEITILEDLEFRDIVVSVKASDVEMALEAYVKIADRMPYPIHVGITESGTAWGGTVKSAVGLGAILSRGIGDTIRVSLAAPPEDEVKAGFEILKALGLRLRGPVLIASSVLRSGRRGHRAVGPGSGEAHRRVRRADQGGRDGLRRERSGRSADGRSGRRGWQGHGPDFPQGQGGGEPAGGPAAGGVVEGSRGDRQRERGRRQGMSVPRGRRGMRRIGQRI